jgi:hypothetical protein
MIMSTVYITKDDDYDDDDDDEDDDDDDIWYYSLDENPEYCKAVCFPIEQTFRQYPLCFHSGHRADEARERTKQSSRDVWDMTSVEMR